MHGVQGDSNPCPKRQKVGGQLLNQPQLCDRAGHSTYMCCFLLLSVAQRLIMVRNTSNGQDEDRRGRTNRSPCVPPTTSHRRCTPIWHSSTLRWAHIINRKFSRSPPRDGRRKAKSGNRLGSGNTRVQLLHNCRPRSSSGINTSPPPQAGVGVCTAHRHYCCAAAFFKKVRLDGRMTSHLHS